MTARRLARSSGVLGVLPEAVEARPIPSCGRSYEAKLACNVTVKPDDIAGAVLRAVEHTSVASSAS